MKENTHTPPLLFVVLLPMALLVAPCLAMDGQPGSSNGQSASDGQQQLRVMRMRQENEIIDNRCCICMDQSINREILRCGHWMCTECFLTMANNLCPMCRRTFSRARQEELRKSLQARAKEEFLSAAYAGEIVRVIHVLSSRPDFINTQDNFGETALIWAAVRGHEDIVRYLVAQRGIDINARRNDGWTALMWAARGGRSAIVRFLVEQRGIRLEVRNNDRKTALNVAQEHGRREIVKILEPAEQQHQIESEFFAAVNGGDTKRVASILSAMPRLINLHWWTFCSNGTELVYSEFRKYSSMTTHVRGSLIDFNVPDNLGLTALMIAAGNGHEATVRLLLAQPGININAQNEAGKTSLMLAAQKGREATVSLLLAQPGININARSARGKTVLMKAVCNDHEAIVRLLLAQPSIDINARNNWGDTAFMLAVQKGREANVRQLLAQPGIDINARDNWGDTALMSVVYHPRKEIRDGWGRKIVKRLGHNEDTIGGQEAIARLLLAQPGMDINARNNWGNTALINAAIDRDYAAIVRLLVAHPGIDLNVRNNRQETALDVAKNAPEGLAYLLGNLIFGRERVKIIQQAMQRRAQASQPINTRDIS